MQATFLLSKLFPQLQLGEYVEAMVDWLLAHAQWLFDAIGWITLRFTGTLESILLAIPAWILALAIAAVAWWRLSWRFGILVLSAVAIIVGMGMWRQTTVTLALVLSATFFSLIVGLPLGVWGAKSERAHQLLRPILDFMQTMPAFVYLIPAAMFFGLGQVPGTIATIIFSMPPTVRLTDLGIRQVPQEMVEAGQAFGCTPAQLLFKVQIPTALPSIMAGINQNIMLALSMVVIASMIGAGGLGNEVLRGIQRLDVGLGFEGGFAVVLLAIMLDRITQSFGKGQSQ